MDRCWESHFEQGAGVEAWAAWVSRMSSLKRDLLNLCGAVAEEDDLWTDQLYSRDKEQEAERASEALLLRQPLVGSVCVGC